jgi:hypothetical protein
MLPSVFWYVMQLICRNQPVGAYAVCRCRVWVFTLSPMCPARVRGNGNSINSSTPPPHPLIPRYLYHRLQAQTHVPVRSRRDMVGGGKKSCTWVICKMSAAQDCAPLCSVLHRMHARLSPAQQKAVALGSRFLSASGGTRVGTMCSGTDSPMLVLKALTAIGIDIKAPLH